MTTTELPAKGKLSHKGAKTLDPEKNIDIDADYEFFDKGYILVVKNYLHYCQNLIQCAEKVGLWAEATLANSPDNVYRDQAMRSSKNMYISGASHPDLAPYETLLQDSFHNCVKLYLYRNTFAKVKADTGYEMLKYSVGCQFGEHVDIIPGHPQWGYRRLSGLAYLNDDYTGGELKFTRQDLTFKPEAGSVVIFPSDFTYPHASLPIIQGTKYSVVTWFT